MSRLTWHLFSGEYPPSPGGVSDYTSLLASALARSGESVHVWTSGDEGSSIDGDGVTIHREAGRWLASDLARLDAALDRIPGERVLSIQYVPNNFGRRGLNLTFARWVRRRGKRDTVRVMFHEVAYPFRLIDRPTRWFLAAVQRLIARDLFRAGDVAFVSIPAWDRMLRLWTPGARTRVEWLPVPSNVPEVFDREKVEEMRRRVGPPGTSIVGAFGTYGPWLRDRLSLIIGRLLDGHPERAVLILGRNGDRFAADLIAARPDLAGRVLGTGAIAREPLSHALQACDLFLQPYPDGVSCRRGSTMACVGHGRAVVTTHGRLTEPIWSEAGAVRLAPADDPEASIREAEALLADPEARDRLGRAARDLYERRFDLQRTVEVMLRESQSRNASAMASAAPRVGMREPSDHET